MKDAKLRYMGYFKAFGHLIQQRFSVAGICASIKSPEPLRHGSAGQDRIE
jgi:hypothetical protein